MLGERHSERREEPRTVKASECWGGGGGLTQGQVHGPRQGVQELTYFFHGPISGAQVSCSVLNAEIPWARECLLGTKFLSG